MYDPSSEENTFLSQSLETLRENSPLETENPSFSIPLAVQLYCIANEFSSQGYLKKAITIFRQVLTLDPKFAKAHRDLGALLWKTKKYEDAKKELEEARDLNPNDAVTHNALALLLLDENSDAAALGELQEAIRLDPTYAEAYYNLGCCLLDQKNYRDADTALEKALEFKSQFPPAQEARSAANNGWGRVLCKQKKYGEAKAKFSLAFEIDPKNTTAKQNVEHVSEILESQERERMEKSTATPSKELSPKEELEVFGILDPSTLKANGKNGRGKTASGRAKRQPGFTTSTTTPQSSAAVAITSSPTLTSTSTQTSKLATQTTATPINTTPVAEPPSVLPPAEEQAIQETAVPGEPVRSILTKIAKDQSLTPIKKQTIELALRFFSNESDPSATTFAEQIRSIATKIANDPSSSTQLCCELISHLGEMAFCGVLQGNYDDIVLDILDRMLESPFLPTAPTLYDYSVFLAGLVNLSLPEIDLWSNSKQVSLETPSLPGKDPSSNSEKPKCLRKIHLSCDYERLIKPLLTQLAKPSEKNITAEILAKIIYSLGHLTADGYINPKRGRELSQNWENNLNFLLEKFCKSVTPNTEAHVYGLVFYGLGKFALCNSIDPHKIYMPDWKANLNSLIEKYEAASVNMHHQNSLAEADEATKSGINWLYDNDLCDITGESVVNSKNQVILICSSSMFASTRTTAPIPATSSFNPQSTN